MTDAVLSAKWPYMTAYSRNALKEAAQMAGLTVDRMCDVNEVASRMLDVDRHTETFVLAFSLDGGFFRACVVCMDMDISSNDFCQSGELVAGQVTSLQVFFREHQCLLLATSVQKWL